MARGKGDGPLQVLLVADELDPHGGAERSQVEVAEELARRGAQVDVLYARPGAFLPRYEAFARSLTRVPAAQGDGTRRTDAGVLLACVRGTRAAGRADVVYANSIRLSFVAGAVGRARRLPVVCHLRLPDPPGPSVKNRLGLSGVSRFIAVSEHTRARHVAAGLPAGRIDVVHNGIEPGHFPLADDAARRAARTELGLPDDAFIVLYAGRLDPAKGVDVLLEAWRRARPDDVLLLAGAPREALPGERAADYAEQLRRSGAGPGVRWLGRRLDVVPLYAAADVVALPSLFPEPFGRVVVEAMSCGRPVVAAASGGVPEIVGGAFPELLVPPGDVASLWAGIERLRTWRIDDPGLAGRLRTHVERSFSLDATATGIERVLRAAVRSGRSGRSGW